MPWRAPSWTTSSRSTIRIQRLARQADLCGHFAGGRLAELLVEAEQVLVLTLELGGRQRHAVHLGGPGRGGGRAALVVGARAEGHDEDDDDCAEEGPGDESALVLAHFIEHESRCPESDGDGAESAGWKVEHLSRGRIECKRLRGLRGSLARTDSALPRAHPRRRPAPRPPRRLRGAREGAGRALARRQDRARHHLSTRAAALLVRHRGAAGLERLRRAPGGARSGRRAAPRRDRAPDRERAAAPAAARERPAAAPPRALRGDARAPLDQRPRDRRRDGAGGLPDADARSRGRRRARADDAGGGRRRGGRPDPGRHWPHRRRAARHRPQLLHRGACGAHPRARQRPRQRQARVLAAGVRAEERGHD